MKYILLSLLVVTAHAVRAQELLGFVGGWRMDSNCQLIDISSTSPAGGALIDVSLTTNSKNAPNTALSFIQTSSYISLGVVDKFKLANDKSISFFVKPVPLGSNHQGSIFSYGSGFNIRYIEQGANLRLEIIFGGTSYLTRNLTANEWQHVTITFQKDFSASRSKIFYYVDGALVAEADQPKSANTFNNVVALIGFENPYSTTTGFRGSLDNLKIYNRTLTSAEVQNLALPVTLEYFRARKSDGPVELTWKTQIEENVSHFELQKSSDGQNFKTITSVDAGKYEYLAYDASDNSGMGWYRLKVVDIDGKVTFSNVVRVAGNQTDVAMKLFPNPGTQKIQIVGSSGYGKISVFNNAGKMVKQQQFSTTNTLDISSLPPGLYYIIFFDGNKKMSSKFTKL